MGKHHVSKGAAKRGETALLDRNQERRQIADPERPEVIEPDRGANVSAGEADLRQRVHTDRSPQDEFQLAAHSPQQAGEKP